MEKYWIALGLIFIAALVATQFIEVKTGPSDYELFFCNNVSDCVDIPHSDCCSAHIFINRNYVNYWNEQHSCNDTICALSVQYTAYTPECSNNKCQTIATEPGIPSIQTIPSPNSVIIMSISRDLMNVKGMYVIANGIGRNCTWSNNSTLKPGDTVTCVFDGAPCLSGQELKVTTASSYDKATCPNF